ncbi:hypothetical protein BFX06_11950 [Sulfobacillus thermosulfidooxidans]|nr:hypothetical protein BFX05_09835 [Sulfobacillus thermosulfidooxidans]OLZ13239.1 hypothetical protein BFX06_11950 [Sulfobacillus thermosulfidooxidans]OLZ21619.1 hypothetical protein BFX07_12375 [Sulfobacillus thermosulfidooxidans]
MNFIRPVIKIEDMMFMTGVFLKLCSALSGPIKKIKISRNGREMQWLLKVTMGYHVVGLII